MVMAPKVSKQSQGCNLVIIMQDHALALTRHILVIGMALPQTRRKA
jgi:hypothetical protein